MFLFTYIVSNQMIIQELNSTKQNQVCGRSLSNSFDCYMFENIYHNGCDDDEANGNNCDYENNVFDDFE